MVRNILAKFAGLPLAAVIFAVVSLAGAQNAAAQTNCSLRVVIEDNPFPNVTTSEVSGNLTFSDTAVSTQTATIPANGAPMNSLLLYVNERDCPVRVDSVTITDDGGANTPMFDGLFGGLTLAAGVYTFPTGAEVFAGAANTDATIYPLNITGGATVEITGQVQLRDPACDDTSVLRFEDAFGGAIVDCSTDTYTFPTGAESFAGFGDTTRGSQYPFLIPYGATITFDGSTASGTADVTFAFENNPFPNNTVVVRPPAVSVSGATASYSIDVPADPPNTDATFNNLILYVETRDVPVTVSNIVITPNPPPANPPATPVPTLPIWGLLGLVGLIGFLGLRRRA